MPPTVARGGRRALGALLLAVAFLPLYRLVDTSGEAGYRETAVTAAEAALGYAIWGTFLTLLAAALLAVILRASALRHRVSQTAGMLAALPLGAWALVLGLVSTSLAAAVAHRLYRGLLTNVDEMASTLQARYLAEGLLAGPTHGVPEFWLIPNTLVVGEGLVSQYPPAHLLTLAAGEALSVPTLTGPLCFGAMVALLALAFPRLLPERPGTARMAALLVALSPFLLFLGGGSMNHVSTGAFLAAALYASLRARDGGAPWTVVAGVAVGLAVADRPLTGLVLGTVATLGVWVPRLVTGDRGARWLLSRGAGTIVGGAPVALLLAWYNDRLFGSPSRLGYLAAFGERHGLGFHQDPWGYAYGWLEALGLTSVDVVTVGTQLLETPVPATGLIGVWLLVARRIPRGAGVLLAWAFLPILANGYYWFHSGRLLYEAVPAWLALCALAASDLAGGGDFSGRRARLGDAAAWTLLVAVVGSVVWGTPDRVRAYAWDEETLSRITVPASPLGTPALVFVHSSWNERMSATLQGAGAMRQDTVITALRRNTSCSLHRYASARTDLVRHGRPVELPEIDLLQLPGASPEIRVAPLEAGGTVRIRDGEPFPPECLRELTADRLGAVALAPLVWQGDLPGIEAGRPLFVRDFGPERNRVVLDLYPDREAFVFTPTSIGAAPELVAYDVGMALLWEASPAPPSAPPRPEA